MSRAIDEEAFRAVVLAANPPIPRFWEDAAAVDQFVLTKTLQFQNATVGYEVEPTKATAQRKITHHRAFALITVRNQALGLHRDYRIRLPAPLHGKERLEQRNQFARLSKIEQVALSEVRPIYQDLLERQERVVGHEFERILLRHKALGHPPGWAIGEWKSRFGDAPIQWGTWRRYVQKGRGATWQPLPVDEPERKASELPLDQDRQETAEALQREIEVIPSETREVLDFERSGLSELITAENRQLGQCCAEAWSNANHLLGSWAEEELSARLTARCQAVTRELCTLLVDGLGPGLDWEPQPVTAQSLKEALAGSRLPGYLAIKRAAEVDARSKSLVVDIDLPLPSEVPAAVGYRFAKKAGGVRPITMKPKQHDELYDSVVKQLVLRTLHEAFQATIPEQVEASVVNGWVAGTDPATGHPTRTCVVSVSATREQFATLKLDQVDPSACVRNLRGLVAGPLAQLAPVQPIMQFDRADRRFVDGRDVLKDLDTSANLAEMPWEEFEQLVRELFGKIFATEGSEVRVTQASRDGGVDAIAFDPDPIRGGKFVIQAKRYTKVVPVSAVRDLYGTMINEGAAKGILVTTAYFGPDSRDFAKDKPITLIDGPRLAFLLEKHGYKVRIDLAEAREHQKSQPS